MKKCKENGVEFHFNTEIDSFKIENNKVTKLISNKGDIIANK